MILVENQHNRQWKYVAPTSNYVRNTFKKYRKVIDLTREGVLIVRHTRIIANAWYTEEIFIRKYTSAIEEQITRILDISRDRNTRRSPVMVSGNTRPLKTTLHNLQNSTIILNLNHIGEPTGLVRDLW